MGERRLTAGRTGFDRVPGSTESAPAQTLQSRLAALPSVETLVGTGAAAALVAAHGRQRLVRTCRAELEAWRHAIRHDATVAAPDPGTILQAVGSRLETDAIPSLRPVFNLTGTVLHTNLGRALLPPEAIAAIVAVARGASNLEYDLDGGRRGERDSHTERLLCDLTGAEAATIVNNNAAAVFLVLNTLALRREVLVSRGELVEIGGSFRVPEIMARAGARLREVGTTNRTHPGDYAEAIGPRTALVMRVHPSNYRVEGFTAAVADPELARIARGADLPFVHDLGSGSLVDLSTYGLPREPTVREAIAAGADLVTFSGDKLLGGPQAGLIVGRRDLVDRLRRNPLKRALRCDKLTIAALSAILRLYGDDETVAAQLPTLRLLTRPQDEIAAMAQRIAPILERALDGFATVSTIACRSQIGSGALPAALLPSAGLRIAGLARGRRASSARPIGEAMRRLPVPIVGRVEAGSLMLDLRCLEDEGGFLHQLDALRGLLTTPAA